MTMFMMKSSQRPPGVQGGSGSSSDEFSALLYTMVMMHVIEAIFRGAPAFFGRLQDAVWRYLARKSQTVSFGVPMLTGKEKRVETASITLVRKYAKKDNNPYIEKVDAIIEHLCNVNTSKHIQLDQRYTLNTSDDVQVSPHITAKVQQVDYDEEGDLDYIKIKLASDSLQVNDLRDWIDEVHRNYVYEKNNKLGNKKFFFNEVPVEPQRQLQRNEYDKHTGEAEYNWATAPATLAFTMNEFHTYKSFRNVFGEHVGELKERLDLFVNHPEWYQERGIPHSLGILLHGIPGAGKTSTIKAIARDTGRHIFNLSLRAYTTQKQLMNLFYNETVAVRGVAGGTQQQTYNIPLNQRIYVIEDIDCLTDIVYDRGANKDAGAGAGASASASEAVNLGFLLNLLDGVLETPGRILTITTNYPEKLDKALVRPGRIDVKIHFTWASRELIREMLENFYGAPAALDAIPADLEGALSPAEVLESLCTHFKSAEGAIQHMKKRVAEREEGVFGASGTALSSLGISDESKNVSEPTNTSPFHSSLLDVFAEAQFIRDTMDPMTTSMIVESSPDVHATQGPTMIVEDANQLLTTGDAQMSDGTRDVVVIGSSSRAKPTNIASTSPVVKPKTKSTGIKSSHGSFMGLASGGSMFGELEYTHYNSGTDITFISPEQAEEFAAAYARRQASRD